MLSPSLRALLRTDFFWSAYLRQADIEEAIPALDHLQLTLDVPESGALILELDSRLIQHKLYLRDRTGERTELGWDDQAQWFPHALRWSEVDVICRAVARTNREYAHPGLAVLLLRPFCPLTDDDPVDAALATMRLAWRSLGLRGQDVPGLGAIDFRGQHVHWITDGRGFISVEQSEDQENTVDLCSLRSRGNDNFPFEGLATLVSGAALTLNH